MKKRLFAWIVLFCLLLTACAGEKEPVMEHPFVLYFPLQKASQNAVFATKTIDLDVSELTVQEIVVRYCEEQPPKGANIAIPPQWKLQEAHCEHSVATVSFQGTGVSSLQTNTAAACLLQTLLQLSDVQTLRLSAPGQEVIQLSKEELLLEDTGMLPQKESIVLYLPDEDGRFLLRQTQTVEAVEAADRPKYVLQQLLDADVNGTCIPYGTRLLSVSVENEICTVNLSSEFLRNMKLSFHEERMAVYAIVNSLTELAEVTTVDFWIEGAPLEELKYMKLPSGIRRDEALISPAETEYFDFSLYVTCDDQTLVRLPCALTEPTEKTEYETAIDTLLAFTPLDGAKACIPEGTKCLSVLREDNICIVDLTSEFLLGCKDAQQEMLAVQSVIATMCALDGVSSVEILVEGLEPTYSVSWLKNLRQPENEWFSELSS
ncbi:MAG: hypothetical protein E7434_03975 [Ruminococcaceae bacterium]|nr:hypothetical protein [Oscillospiraceae bacterium]